MNYQTQTEFHGFRGTIEELANNFDEKWDKHYSCGEDEYLGHGVYFFENDYLEAYNFAKYTRYINEDKISIIYAKIETDKVFDLTIRKNYYEYIELVRKSKKRYRDNNKNLNFKKPYDCRLLNLISCEGDYELIKAQFDLNDKKHDDLRNNGETRIRKTHVQLCVKNKNIIKRIKIYNKEDLEND